MGILLYAWSIQLLSLLWDSSKADPSERKKVKELKFGILSRQKYDGLDF